MNVLVIGSGGREHALVWKITQSKLVSKIFCAPGNAGIAELACLVEIKQTNIPELIKFVKDNKIDLTVVGPEQPLIDGIVDAFESERLMIFGPSKQAAELEGSKVFAKNFMSRNNIPTANFRSFEFEERFEAERYINEVPAPIVIKADGLAAGKGVTVCESKETALDILDEMFTKKSFGKAGEKIVIEDFMIGEELSILVVSDGKDFVVLPPAQDHKRVLDGDLGKNTGGMGAYAPTPFLDEKMLGKIKCTIIKPTVYGMAKEGKPFKGCLYFGLMLTQTGPRVVEYNCRFGDPETQVILPLIENDLVELMLASIRGEISRIKIKIKPVSAVCVVLTSRGYPDSYEVGKPIFGFDKVINIPGLYIFHSGTKKENDTILTAGGRVLGVTAVGNLDNLEETIMTAYRNIEHITFDGAYYRSDIGKKGLGSN
ncbi:MAG: phosphoribosylamine--glycine ligase [Bacteroidetes bacterium]|nr:phosphoribosylamine--glycine ligase [Bacteroidota bacterium]MBU1423642.1 phosphoribosylamine--glycine ligase [Bacteroidota bacterium]MBU2635690.1 phosphoribosylamine--glycine ligase [Bacteroidota bacterium]